MNSDFWVRFDFPIVIIADLFKFISKYGLSLLSLFIIAHSSVILSAIKIIVYVRSNIMAQEVILFEQVI